VIPKYVHETYRTHRKKLVAEIVVGCKENIGKL